MKKYKLVGSSVDSTKVSLTIKGVGVALIPTIVYLGGVFGLNVAEADLTQFVSAIATLISAGMIIVGLLRKAYYAIFPKKNNQ